MTLQIAIEGIQSMQQFKHYLQLEVRGSRAGTLLSQPLTSIEDKWNPKFKVDCSPNDNLEFYLHEMAENRQMEIGFGRLGISGFIRAQGDDLDIKKPQKFLLDLMLHDHQTKKLQLWVTYNPYQLYEGQFCEKVSLSMKTNRRRFISEARGRNERPDSVRSQFTPVSMKDDRFNRFNSAQFDNTHSILGALQSGRREDDEYEHPPEDFRRMTRGPRPKVEERPQEHDVLDAGLPGQSRMASQHKRPMVRGQEPQEREEGSRMDGQFRRIIRPISKNGQNVEQSRAIDNSRRKQSQNEVNFYLGKCQTVNAFSCLDESVKGQQFSFTQSSFAQKGWKRVN